MTLSIWSSNHIFRPQLLQGLVRSYLISILAPTESCKRLAMWLINWNCQQMPRSIQLSMHFYLRSMFYHVKWNICRLWMLARLLKKGSSTLNQLKVQWTHLPVHCTAWEEAMISVVLPGCSRLGGQAGFKGYCQDLGDVGGQGRMECGSEAGCGPDCELGRCVAFWACVPASPCNWVGYRTRQFWSPSPTCCPYPVLFLLCPHSCISSDLSGDWSSITEIGVVIEWPRRWQRVRPCSSNWSEAPGYASFGVRIRLHGCGFPPPLPLLPPPPPSRF